MTLGADFLPRLASALVLAPLALLITWYGGWPFALLWAAAALIVLREWAAMTDMRPRGWAVAGLVYAGTVMLAPVLLRADAMLGLTALFWLFAVVWGTDIAAYFSGRLIGGPKLWPRVSPKKTWSGALGGSLFGTLAGLAVLHGAGLGFSAALVPVTLAVSIASQAGDLFESAMKRRFGVKDSGALIPGHGGLMDRLDGFVAAGGLALLLGLMRNPGAPGQGVLLW
ncbi:MAG TPA: phosphatidate cytidylyltransferase [Xanthobacteraceae bacterium]|nr:phosphatidate cytidylyltransferase [Xanthobacteraceae bacterium]